MMKKSTLILIMMSLLILSGCAEILGGNNRQLTIEEVQQYAAQTLTAQAGGVYVSATEAKGSADGMVIRPVQQNTPTVSSGLTVLDAPDMIVRQPTAVPAIIPTAIPTAAPQYTIPTAAYSQPISQPVTTVCDRIRFIEDVTIPDETRVRPGQTFRKVWRIQNAGSCVWDAGYQLIYTSGDQMGPNFAANLPKTVVPGDTVDVSVDLTAPARYGSFQSNWKLRSSSGNVFGTSNSENDAIWVKIVVANSANLSTVAPGITPVNANCTLLSVVPAYRQTFHPGEETDFSFRVRNDSFTPWTIDDMDIAYIGGENMLKRKEQDRKDLPMDVAPGGVLYYTMDAVVPEFPGTYTMTMAVVRGYEILCSMDATITVMY